MQMNKGSVNIITVPASVYAAEYAALIQAGDLKNVVGKISLSHKAHKIGIEFMKKILVKCQQELTPKRLLYGMLLQIQMLRRCRTRYTKQKGWYDCYCIYTNDAELINQIYLLYWKQLHNL